MVQRLNNPFPFFFSPRGNLLDAGKVYMGEAGKDPESFPLLTYWDKDKQILATQPFSTLGGVIVNGDTPSFVYADGDDYSICVKDADDSTVYSLSSIKVAGEQFQPLDEDLTAIALLQTTAYGRQLLTLANEAGLKAATGIPDPLPANGGSVTGNITRAGSGPHLFHADPAFTSGRVFKTASGAGDPTSLPGDIWFKEE